MKADYQKLRACAEPVCYSFSAVKLFCRSSLGCTRSDMNHLYQKKYDSFKAEPSKTTNEALF